MTWTYRPLRQMEVTSGFGSSFGGPNVSRPRHSGVDFRAAAGTAVYSPAPGVPVLVDGAGDETDPGGVELVIQHDDGTSSGYAHLSEVLVRKGEPVRAGQLIARTGNTGTSTTAPHLHMTARIDGVRTDPLRLIPSALTGGVGVVVLIAAGALAALLLLL